MFSWCASVAKGGLYVSQAVAIGLRGLGEAAALIVHCEEFALEALAPSSILVFRERHSHSDPKVFVDNSGGHDHHRPGNFVSWISISRTQYENLRTEVIRLLF
jgi:hypothetical protein